MIRTASCSGTSYHERLQRLLVRPEGQVDGVADLKAANLSVQLKILNALFPAQLLDVFDFQGVSPQVNTVSQASGLTR